MRGKAWLYLYGLIALLQGLSLLLHWELLRFITKPLLMIFLLVYFLWRSGNGNNSRQWIIAALFFSWLGDIFLMNQGENFFMAGLASFLVAHLCYIAFFISTRKKSFPKSPFNPILLIVLGVYITGFYLFLAPHLQAPLKIPVLAYAVTIASMFYAACLAFPDKKTDAAGWCLLGAGLFIVSDSMLAINSFVQKFRGADLAIMGSYMLAQFALVTGASQVVNFKKNSA